MEKLSKFAGTLAVGAALTLGACEKHEGCAHEVTGKKIRPAWVQPVFTGKVVVPIYHPKSYYIEYKNEEGKTKRLYVGKEKYASLENGDTVYCDGTTSTNSPRAKTREERDEVRRELKGDNGDPAPEPENQIDPDKNRGRRQEQQEIGADQIESMII